MHPGIYLSFRSGGAARDFSVRVSGRAKLELYLCFVF